MKIKIHFFCLIFIIYVFIINKIELYSLFYFSILFHELAHMITALLLNIEITDVLLTPFGISASYNERISPKKEILISFAGPIISFFMCFLSKNKDIFNINFLIGLINLIPIFPLDGGRIQKNFLVWILGYKKGIRISGYVSDFFLIAVFVFSILIVVFSNNYNLLYWTLYLFTLSKKEMKRERILGLINYLQIV